MCIKYIMDHLCLITLFFKIDFLLNWITIKQTQKVKYTMSWINFFNIKNYSNIINVFHKRKTKS